MTKEPLQNVVGSALASNAATVNCLMTEVSG
jgi:hypothetical protein